MEKYGLDGYWKLTILGDNVYHIPEKPMEARVPGSVYGTCLEKGLMPDPYYRDNELEATKLMENDFVYERSFPVTAKQLEADKLLLVFEGVDTLGEILVNGVKAGNVQNMHVRYEFDISSLVREGENELKVLLHSPIRYARLRDAEIHAGGSTDAMEGYTHLRKAHCMFGWDWGPRLPDAGIFRPVYLLAVKKARIGECYVWQTHKKDENGRTCRVGLKIDTRIETVQREAAKQEAFTIKTTVTTPSGEVLQTGEDGSLVIEEPRLWWPNGYGEQPLYTVCVTLFSQAGEILDIWEKKIGLRTVTVDTSKDEWGRSFAHRVNGLNIFAMGADYIPEDNLFGRITPERTKKLLQDAAAAHHNCIRIWGGGYYPDDSFYDCCDELGLLVWQDFMFACSAYELDENFDANITEEVTLNIRRLRHHACMGLWCGNNEMESQTMDGSWGPSLKQRADYIKLFEYIIPKLVKKEDPQGFYWPSSPSSGGNYDDPWDENRGDTHYWDVWHGCKPFTDYRKHHFRYLSEFGFQAFPSLKTVESFTEPEDRNIFSRIMEMHQRNVAANGKILNYISQTYRYPKDFDHLLYTSQLLQAEAIRYGVEHFRRHRGRCMGTLVWQLNDIWPVASWASIDYFGRWKALHYAECRMFAPVLLSCEETGELTERPFCVMERKAPIKKAARLHVANETWETVQGEVFWELRRPDASVMKSGSFAVTVKPFSGVWMEELDFSKEDELSSYISYRLFVDGRVLTDSTTLFTAPKHFSFADPKLAITVSGRQITVSASAYAKGVEIVPLNGEARFSDNYFDLNANEKTVQIVEGDATEFAVRSVYEIANG